MTVTQLRAMLEALEQEGLGSAPVSVSCEVSDECPDGDSGFGFCILADAVVLDYTMEPGTVYRSELTSTEVLEAAK
jgi:hypothetical protein